MTNNTKKIWSSLQDKLAHVCKTERCWIKQEFMDNKLTDNLLNHTFAPNAPDSWKQNPNEWLNSNDIINVMKQYEKAYPSFKFIGPSPIDFDTKKKFGQCVWNELCNFNIKDFIKKRTDKIGIILNTDPHTKGGAHWICIYIDLKKKYVFFFDSNADKTPKEVILLLKRIKEQSKALNIDLTFYRNSMEHQKTDTECGVYTLFTITQLLTNKLNLNDFDKRIPDSRMEKLRSKFFN